MGEPTARFLSTVCAIFETACFGIRYLGFQGNISSAVKAKVVPKKPASPYFIYRLLYDPPGRYVTEHGELLLMPEVPTPTLVDFVVEEHVTPRDQNNPYTAAELKRMKPGDPKVRVHWDVRWRDPETGEVHAVAISQARLPEKGERFQVIKVDDRHGHTELVNTGTPIRKGHVLIEDGYGRGHSRVIHQGKTFIWSGKDNSFHIWIDGKGYAMIQPDYAKQGKPDKYLMFPLKVEDPPHFDRPFIATSADADQLQRLIEDPSWVAEHKYDGAFYTIVVKQRSGHDYSTVQVISRRSRHVNGQPTGIGIDRSYKLLHVKFAQWPKWAEGEKIYVEVHSKVKGSNNSPHGRSTSILNRDEVEAFEEQLANGWLEVTILGFEEGTYDEQRAKAERLADEVVFYDSRGRAVKPLSVPKNAKTPGAKQKLIDQAKAKNEEGVVFKRREGAPHLVKHVFKGETEDMVIEDVVMMKTQQPKYLNETGQVIAAQNFVVRDQNGKLHTVPIRDPEGVLGSTDKLRLDAGQNPEKYIGGYVEVRARRSNRSQASDIVRLRFDKD